MDILESIYCDYRIAMPPSAEVTDMIRKYKLSSAKVLGPYRGMDRLTPITVTTQTRQLPVMMLPKLDYYQKKMHIKACYVHIKGFDYFKHGASMATIYAQIELNAEFETWFSQLKRIFGDTRKSVPHIAVVEDIPIMAFNRLWPYFEVRTYNAHFLADKLTVLSRPTMGNDDSEWKPFKEIYLKKIN